MRKIIPAIFMVSLILFSSMTGFAQEPVAGQSSNKVYIVYLNDAKVDAYIVTNIEAVDFQGIKCLKATAADLPGWFRATKAVYFPVDKVSNIVEYNSLDEYKNSLK